MRLPAASLTVTTEPASAVPEMVSPLVGLTVGAFGAALSTVAVVAGPVLPAASVAETPRVVPCARGVAGLMA